MDSADTTSLRPSSSNDSSNTSTIGAAYRTLRTWPGVVLVALSWLAHWLPSLFLEGGMVAFLVMFMGPLAAAFLVGIWWLTFSRATWRERLFGGGAVVVGLILTSLAADRSVKGMGIMMFTVPWTATAFVGATTLLASRAPRQRTGIALSAVLLTFIYTGLIRVDGIRGDMVSDVRWRWSPTTEDEFLARKNLAQKATSSPGEENTDGGEWTPPEQAEWPEFRGPGRIAHAPGVTLDADWTAHPPKEIWRQPIGPGWSSFCVVGERLFTQEQRGEVEAVVCYDAATGRELWVHTDPQRFWETVGGAGPRATPTYIDGWLYTVGANGTVNCLDPRTGKPRWQADLRKDSGAAPPMWGFSSSPLVIDGIVVVYAGGSGLTPNKETSKVEKGIVGYDASTGELRWTAAAGDHGYGSPHLYSQGNTTLALVLSNSGLDAIVPSTGKLAWEYPWKAEGYRVVQPISVGDNGLLLGTGNGVGTRRITIDCQGENFQAKDDWTSREMKPYFNDFVAFGDHLYGFDHDIFACVDLTTGKRTWKKGRYGSGQVLLVPDSAHLLVLSESGDLVLLKADPTKHVELSRIKALEGKTWNHPVLVGNRLYLRNGQEAACYELATTPKPAE